MTEIELDRVRKNNAHTHLTEIELDRDRKSAYTSTEEEKARDRKRKHKLNLTGFLVVERVVGSLDDLLAGAARLLRVLDKKWRLYWACTRSWRDPLTPPFGLFNISKNLGTIEPFGNWAPLGIPKNSISRKPPILT